ncbi:MAG: chemotaxis protein CheW [Planctomycetota bacterium]|jgi:purine-binding chemotaxis protein CheW
MHEIEGYWHAWNGGSGRGKLNFTLAGEDYALDFYRVREILESAEIHHLVDAPGFVKGFVRQRGRKIPVVDLCVKLGKGDCRAPGELKVLVVDFDCQEVGLLVERVCEACRFEDEDPLCQGETEIFPCSNLVGGWGCGGGKPLISLELENLFSFEDLKALQACIAGRN